MLVDALLWLRNRGANPLAIHSREYRDTNELRPIRVFAALLEVPSANIVRRARQDASGSQSMRPGTSSTCSLISGKGQGRRKGGRTTLNVLVPKRTDQNRHSAPNPLMTIVARSGRWVNEAAIQLDRPRCLVEARARTTVMRTYSNLARQRTSKTSGSTLEAICRGRKPQPRSYCRVRREEGQGPHGIRRSYHAGGIKSFVLLP
jgi:hypothetical protein